MKKVLVLGSTGLIGHQVFNHLKSCGRYNLYNFSYRKKLQDDTTLLDLRNFDNFYQNIIDISPNFIINCVGLLINGSNADPENAIFLNSYLPHRLARVADEIKAKLIHISTDCVFSGDKNEPYVEQDEKDGRGIYPRSKGLGEIITNKHLTLRTSVVGPELKRDGEELFHWFMNETGEVRGYTDAIWSGVTTIELAKAVECSIRKNISGLYHVTNNSFINKYDLLKLFQKYTSKDTTISPVAGYKTNKSFLDTRKLLDFEIPSYEIMISEMVEFMRNNESLYSQYGLK